MSAVQPGYKKTEIGTIPEDWSCRALGEFCVTYSGGTPTTSIRDYYGGNIPWITSSDLNQGNIESVSGRITPLGLDNSSAKMVNPNSLLIALYGATAGTTAITRISGAINQAILAIIPKSGSTTFIYQYLRLKKDWIIKTFTQGGQPNLSGEIVKSLIIPIPDESEQSFIAVTLSGMDSLIRTLDQLIAKKRDIQQAAMQQLLTGQRRLPGFSGEWKDGKLRDVVRSLEAGVSVNSSDDLPEPGLPCVLKTSALSGGNFFPNEAKTIVPADRGRACTNPKRNTILISRMNTPALVGEIAYVGKDYDWLFLPDRLWMTRFMSDDCVNARWLAYLLSSRPYRRLLQDSATGTSGSMKNISKGVLLSLQISYPAIEEQTAIATILSDMDSELAALEARRDKARQLKQGMMQELLTGRIRLV